MAAKVVPVYLLFVVFDWNRAAEQNIASERVKLPCDSQPKEEPCRYLPDYIGIYIRKGELREL